MAKCSAPNSLSATSGGCVTVQTAAALATAINNGSTSPGAPLTLNVVPPASLPTSNSYTLTAGDSYIFTLVASNAAGEQQQTCSQRRLRKSSLCPHQSLFSKGDQNLHLGIDNGTSCGAMCSNAFMAVLLICHMLCLVHVYNLHKKYSRQLQALKAACCMCGRREQHVPDHSVSRNHSQANGNLRLQRHLLLPQR